jgi:hypothetical protein
MRHAANCNISEKLSEDCSCTLQAKSSLLIDRFESLEGPLRELGADQLAAEVWDAVCVMREYHDRLIDAETSLKIFDDTGTSEYWMRHQNPIS